MWIEGKYNRAEVFADCLEVNAEKQLRQICSLPCAAGWNIRVMPDVHYCSILRVNGLTASFGGELPPALLGFDIGCGLLVARLRQREVNLQKLHEAVLRSIPCWPSERAWPHPLALDFPWEKLRCQSAISRDKALSKVGVLVTGGNHFIELCRGEDGGLYLTFHAGCVGVAKYIAQHYQELACEAAGLPPIFARDIGPDSFRNVGAACTLSGEALGDYMNDVETVSELARLSRHIMLEELCEDMGLEVEESFDTMHNTLTAKERILRKGAVSAREGERLYIPINMRDGGYICRGRGNEDWNCSAPHGAGRVLTRRQAARQIGVEEYRKASPSVYIPEGTEAVADAPQAYKPAEEILRRISPTVEVLEHLTPLYNFKSNG